MTSREGLENQTSWRARRAAKHLVKGQKQTFLGPFPEPQFPEGNRELFTGTLAQLHPRFIS
jgi:hypothetical protein